MQTLVQGSADLWTLYAINWSALGVIELHLDKNFMRKKYRTAVSENDVIS
jgi:hypothetical protein